MAARSRAGLGADALGADLGDVVAADSSISLSTVYRTMKLLGDIGAIHRHAFEGGPSRFEHAGGVIDRLLTASARDSLPSGELELAWRVITTVAYDASPFDDAALAH